jgi:hypothetical protein
MAIGAPCRARRRRAAAIGLTVVVVLLLVPAVAAAAGNDVGENVGRLLRHFAGELYAGIIAIVSLVFLIHRRYAELATFLLAAVVVAWLVFSPDQVASAARTIGNQIF